MSYALKLLLLLLPFFLLNCQPEDKALGGSKEWMILSDGYEQRYDKGSVLRTTGDSVEIFEPGYTRAATFSLRTNGDTLHIGKDTFLSERTPQEWTFRRAHSKDTIRAIPMRVTENILSDSMLIGRTLLEQRDLAHREVYLGPTVIEQYANQNYFKVRCFGEGATGNDFGMQHDQEGWSVCRRFGQPILQFWQLGFGLITLIDSVKDQRIYGKQFPTDQSGICWDSERLIVPKRGFSKVEIDRFFQLINEGRLKYQLPKSRLDPDALALNDEISMEERDTFSDYLISPDLQAKLKMNGNNNLQGRISSVPNEAMANRAYFLPEDLGQLGLNFEPNYRFSVFSGERIIRQGLYKMSSDKRWLELNGGCESTAYWHIDRFESDHLTLSAFIEIAISANQYETKLADLMVTFDFSLDDQAGTQVQEEGIQ